MYASFLPVANDLLPQGNQPSGRNMVVYSQSPTSSGARCTEAAYIYIYISCDSASKAKEFRKGEEEWTAFRHQEPPFSGNRVNHCGILGHIELDKVGHDDVSKPEKVEIPRLYYFETVP